MKQNLKIIVSNPIRMHTHKLCAGLAKADRLQQFYTSLWYKPDSFVTKLFCSLPVLGKTVKNILLKRYDCEVPAEKVKTYPYYEIERQIKRRLSFCKLDELSNLYENRKHDYWVSKQLQNSKYDIFIGYETASLQSFKTAKKQKKITILDLTQVHWKYIGYLRDKYPIFKSMQVDDVFEKVSAVKKEELKYVDYILALSTFARDTLINNGIDKKKIRVVNLGFNAAKFTCKEIYNTDIQKSLKLIFAGTITRRKGIHLVLEAVKQLGNVELNIVGPMAGGKEFMDKYKGHYTYFPFLHHDELAKKFRKADLFVFPSYLDSWGMVVLEAMACGIPVIITENTGSKDVVRQGGGKIIPVDNLEALKSAIQYYNENRSKLEEDGRKACEVVQNYTWEHYYKQVNNAIIEIAEKENL
jgi:glycosyltransferase involved in cell wall biosynthesis